jgi:hypothetical protein
MKSARRMMLVCLSLLAAAALRAGPETAEAERLVRQLGSDDFAEREAATKALLRLGQAAFPALRNARHSQDVEVRRRAEELWDRLDIPYNLVRRLGGWCELDETAPEKPLLRVRLSFTAVKDADLAGLRQCDRLISLELAGTRVSPAGLAHIEHLRSLRTITLPSPMTDEGLEHIKGLTELVELALVGPGVTDKGIACLKEMRKMRCLSLVKTAVTDDGLRHLAGMKDLEALILVDTKVTVKGLAHLKDLPKLRDVYLTKTGNAESDLDGVRTLDKLRGWADHARATRQRAPR